MPVTRQANEDSPGVNLIVKEVSSTCHEHAPGNRMKNWSPLNLSVVDRCCPCQSGVWLPHAGKRCLAGPEDQHTSPPPAPGDPQSNNSQWSTATLRAASTDAAASALHHVVVGRELQSGTLQNVPPRVNASDCSRLLLRTLIQRRVISSSQRARCIIMDLYKNEWHLNRRIGVQIAICMM